MTAPGAIASGGDALQPSALPPARVGFAAVHAPERLAATLVAFYDCAASRVSSSCDDNRWWNRIATARPRFPGHPQPRLPGELGWYAPNAPATLARQRALAQRHGLSAFCFAVGCVEDLSAAPLAALRSAEEGALSFCLAWSAQRASPQAAAAASSAGDAADGDGLLSALLDCLRDPRYLCLDGRPLLLVERGIWTAEAARRDAGEGAGTPTPAIAHLRALCAEAELPVPCLVAIDPPGDPRAFGCDAALASGLTPEAVDAARTNRSDAAQEASASDESLRCIDYAALAEWAAARPAPDYPEIRSVACGWDPTPRLSCVDAGEDGAFGRRLPIGAGLGDDTVCVGATPARYAAWLRATLVHAQAHPVAGAALAFVHAWNDWAGGACLEPDADHGYDWLQQTRNALALPGERPGLALMVHDAQPHGAQYLALHLLEEFARLGVRVETLLQDGGALDTRMEALAPLHRLSALSPEASAALAAELRARGIHTVIANTAVCGRRIAPFRAAGMRVVSLIHELPGVIAYYGLQEPLARLIVASDRVVISARLVRDSLLAAFPDSGLERRLVALPQGLYKRNRHAGGRDMVAARVRLRDRLGLPHHVAVAVAIGYANERKGVDLLARAALRACAQRPDLTIVWVGERDPDFCLRVDALLRQAGLEQRFRFVGFDYDTDDYYAGADVYALASREDPLPSVALESLSVGTPVVAFAGTGGAADLVDGRAGIVVPAFDVDAYASALLRVINDPALRGSLGDAGRALVERDFSFRRYAMDLLALAGDPLPAVSAVVPNRDYAHHLPERIDSIAAQSHPVAEIVVLDDASADNSLEVLALQRMYVEPLLAIVPSVQPSGSVFRQWLAGVRRARGEFVWIAEADDVADPGLIEALLAPMRADGGIVMAYAQSTRIDGRGTRVAPDYLGYTDDLDAQRWRSAYTASGAEEVAAGLAVKNTIPNVSAALFRRAPLLEVLERRIGELATYRIAGDWVTYLYLLQCGRIHFVPHVLNHHRYHAGSATARLDRQRHFDEVVSVQALARRLYPLDARVQAAAAAYAERLRLHFGLSEPD